METRKRKHRQWRYIKKRLLIVLVFLVVVFAAIFVSVGINMNPAALSLAEARVTALTSTALNESILESMSKDEVYAQLISMNNTSSNVYMLHADTVKMNTLAASSSEAAQKRIAGIAIPIGTLTNIPFLAGVGPDIRVKFEPAGSVVSEFKSELKSAGINQTLYRVKVRLTASLKLILPSVWEDITVSAEIAVAEGVIVGDVPQVYTNVANEEDMLNLIPTEIQ